MPRFTPNIIPPTAKRIPKTLHQLGRMRIDNYAWMKDDNWQKVMSAPHMLDSNIRAHLDAENAYTIAVTSDLMELRNDVFAEMKARIEPDSSTVPDPDGPYAYYHRYREGDQHGLYVRIKAGEQENAEHIILDTEHLAKSAGPFFDLGTLTHSPDHKHIAYSIDIKGAENYEIFIKSIASTTIQSTGIERSAGSMQWSADSRTIFWVERDENQRPSKVYCQDVFDSAAKPHLVYEENDPGFFVSISESDSGSYIEITAHNHTTSEIWLIPSTSPLTNPVCFKKREYGLEYSLHEQGDYFYILTNANDAVDFKIMRRKIEAKTEEWDDYIAHKSGRLILGLESYKNFLVQLVRENALPRILIRNMNTGEDHSIAFDEEAYALGLAGGYEYDTNRLRFVYSSPKTPGQVFDYDMQNRKRYLRKTQKVPSGHTPKDYSTERLMLPARDGIEIPVTLIYKTSTKMDGSAPCLLYGYGSYGITIPASFRTSILSLIDRGFVYAIAHIRGGMAKGYQWYLDGKLEKKMNTFTDFVDVGRTLCDRKVTSRGKIVSHGGSAGGLLVGAALNLDPELFGGVISAVPFVDVLNTMSDAELPLTPPEWPEWGNPLEDETAYEQILAYSPYDQVIPQNYPPVLITAGLTDPRVTYWEPAKWAAKLRDNQKGNAPILLKVNMEAGHQGESGRYDSLKETALEYAFAIATIN